VIVVKKFFSSIWNAIRKIFSIFGSKKKGKSGRKNPIRKIVKAVKKAYVKFWRWVYRLQSYKIPKQPKVKVKAVRVV
jgi:hypothetical protein